MGLGYFWECIKYHYDFVDDTYYIQRARMNKDGKFGTCQHHIPLVPDSMESVVTNTFEFMHFVILQHVERSLYNC